MMGSSLGPLRGPVATLISPQWEVRHSKKVFKEVIVHYFLNYAYGWGRRENPRIFIGHSENYCKMCLVWLLVDLGMAVRSIHNFFFHSCRSYLDILLLIFVMSQNLRLVSILKKEYALSTWNRIQLYIGQ